MSAFLVGIAFVGCALLQVTVIPDSSLLPIAPNPTLVLLLIWSAVRGAEEGLVWAFGVGLLLDALSLDPLGGNALALMPVALVGGLAGKRFFQSGLIVPLIAAVVATALHAMVLLLVRSAGGDSLPVISIVRVVGIQALLNVVLVPPIYLVIHLLHRNTVDNHVWT